MRTAELLLVALALFRAYPPRGPDMKALEICVVDVEGGNATCSSRHR
jgi:hypothetical protein